MWLSFSFLPSPTFSYRTYRVVRQAFVDRQLSVEENEWRSGLSCDRAPFRSLLFPEVFQKCCDPEHDQRQREKGEDTTCQHHGPTHYALTLAWRLDERGGSLRETGSGFDDDASRKNSSGKKEFQSHESVSFPKPDC